MVTRPDGQLLSEVAADGSESAFEELVQRHGSLVLNQSLRLLSNRQDAEDATQAVFLVLWEKASRQQNSLSVAGWLHRTTQYVCRNAQRSRQLRITKEQRAMETIESSPNDNDQWNEIKDVLDDELDRLPEKYRLPLILFHLEERQLTEIAELMHSNCSTIETRLRRGREMLRQRIVRRGIAINTASLMAVIGIHATTSHLSVSIVTATVNSASLFAAGQIIPTTLLSPQTIALAKGALPMLANTKLKIIVAAIVGVLLLGGMSSMMIRTGDHSDAPQTGLASSDSDAVTRQELLQNNAEDRARLQTIITALEKQREQVQSLSIETKSYGEFFVDPKVLGSWKRFASPGLPDPTYEFEKTFAYAVGKYYWRQVSSTKRTSSENDQLGARRETSNIERGWDGMRLWSRLVNFQNGQTVLNIWPSEPTTSWPYNPEYFTNIGWDCMTALNTNDEARLQQHRKYDFLSLLKEGVFSIDPGTTNLNGANCVVLRRTHEVELTEYNPATEENVVVNSTNTDSYWLDIDRGFAMQKREHDNQRWGLSRSIHSEFVEILPGLWFPEKIQSLTYAPPDASQEYQGKLVRSWNCDLIHWSANDVPDILFEVVTNPGEILYENGKKKIIDENNQPVDFPSENQETDRFPER
ncbi:ECF RNA polymerase sigma factor SigW [Polystyrenella longa]|uniref:ECF RNA polymerase sigma factor SigW n=1 Tax=Polystyrenella longa TaxID=2528007 RepID=A0A518CU47_9PLAN|nr:sigma-70 family RNA polymerase sigma factor [Polystyrenella longa]QDU82741.1 ECF RNA polymerase sigma factor SigW [Polystyrenella longa]